MTGSDYFSYFRQPLPLTTGLLAVCLWLLAFGGGLQPLSDASYVSTMAWSGRSPGEQIEIVALDDESVKRLGGWPLSRAVIAQVLSRLQGGGARLLGVSLLLDKSQYAEPLGRLDAAIDYYGRSSLVNIPFQQETETSVATPGNAAQRNAEIQLLAEKLQHARAALNTDEQLATALRGSTPVILGMPFWLGADDPSETAANVATTLLYAGEFPPDLLRERLPQVSSPFSQIRREPRQAALALPPLPLFAQAAAGVGGFAPGDFDRHRSPYLDPLVFRYRDQYFPALSLRLAAAALGIAHPRIEVKLGDGLRLDPLRIVTDAQLQLRPFLYPARPQQATAFAVTPLYQVYEDRVPAEVFRDKIVLLGLTASSQLVPSAATANAAQPPVFLLANSLASLLNQDFIEAPDWGFWLDSAVLLLALLYLLGGLPRLRGSRGYLVTGGLVLGLLGLSGWLLLARGLWLPLWASVLLLVLGQGAFWLHQRWASFKRALSLHPDTIEANRLLGLAYQGQGRLALAFEKFSHCPPDEQMLGLLYNLALDFERKQQHREAAGVYRYMRDHNPDYRDAEQRLRRLQEHATRLGRQIKRNSLSAWLEANSELRKPMLGRYQIEKKLGRGAMGVVYLGHDAKMDRMVAIKTLALSEEFEGEDLQEATARFFREASAAGRLTHEYITTVYDAGEEDDLAYIAMEFFKGGTLMPYTRLDSLLPLDVVLEIAIKAAEALHYAHSQGVVHRDIKPANILYNPGNGQIKVTDFGIARITDTQKTKTGVILGTPSYMSPEQLAGKGVDGRSDLFSLGVTLYQLLTGSLPFQAESMASLMFKIATESPVDILSLRDNLPGCLAVMIERLLDKNPGSREPDGAALAASLRHCRDLWIRQCYQSTPATATDTALPDSDLPHV